MKGKNMKRLEFRTAIIGGGAAGMMAAVSASRILSGQQIVLLEKNPVLGRKVSAAGNGRCNFSNRSCRWQDYGGQDLSVVRGAFNCLSPKDTVILFEELGVLSREEEGRLYPYPEQASSVTEALREELTVNGIDIRLSTEVTAVEKKGNEFVIKYGDRTLRTQNLIIAAGGKAGHKYGSTGDGYGFAKGFGHTLQRPLPALVQIVTGDSFASRLKGVRAKGVVSLVKGARIVAREEGEIQFTEDGMSGICVFDLSRYLGEEPADFRIQVDLLPEYPLDRLVELLVKRQERMAGRRGESLLKGMLKDRLIPVYLELADIDADSPIERVDRARLLLLAELLKCREVAVKGTKGWVEAQVTAGGVKGSELQSETLESKLVPGLFLAGEVLDVDGRCGGWNLQWAWSSGWTAGKYAAGVEN